MCLSLIEKIDFVEDEDICMSISADSSSNETLNRGPLVLLLQRQYEFPFGIDKVQFSIFFNLFSILFLSVEGIFVKFQIVKCKNYCSSFNFVNLENNLNYHSRYLLIGKYLDFDISHK